MNTINVYTIFDNEFIDKLRSTPSNAEFRKLIQSRYPSKLSDEVIEKAGIDWCLGTDENGVVNAGDDYENHELHGFIAGVKWAGGACEVS
jgi:hypothetical protein